MTTQVGVAPSNPYTTPDPLVAPNTGTYTGTPGSAVLEVTLTTSLATSASPIVSGTTNMHAETYNGAIPGPTLRLTVGDTVIARLVNNLPYPTGIHWHGIELANSADGTEVTQGDVRPGNPPIQTLGGPGGVPAGGTYLYKFKVTRPGIYWYHPHHGNSPNRVFRGLYGMIVVTDANENSLADGVVLPLPADTKQIVLSDITVCKGNTAASNPPYDPTLPWVGTTTPGPTFGMPLPVQPGTTPASLCVTSAVNDDGTAPPVPPYALGDVPSIMVMAGRINEGQTVLTNGVNVGARGGTPSAPAPVPLDATNHRLQVLSGQGLRLQIVNCATVRYFRLILTTDTGTLVPLVRVGGEGGLLDNAVVEGPVGTFDPKYTSGEILLPPSVRADVVATIPTGLTVGSVLTLWTQDFQRLEGSSPSGFVNIPTVPVMHLEVIAGAGTYPGIVAGTPLRARATFPGPLVVDIRTPATTGSLLPPAPKPGTSNPDIQLTNGPPPGIDSVDGSPLHGSSPYTSTPHIPSSRYAERGLLLELTVTNMSSAHHPFHLHGFSMQPKSLAPRTGAPPATQASTTGTFTWPYQEFRDSINVPANYTLTFRVRLDDRALVDGATLGGWLGRWLFHCHIFFHHHRGMIGEFVVTDESVRERPYVDVGGSWAYAGAPAPQRRGTFFSPEGSPMTLTAAYGAAGAASLTPTVAPVVTSTPAGSTPGTWSWTYPGGFADGVYYVYVTALDTVTNLRGQTVFRLKVGPPDDGADNGDPHIHTVDGKRYDFQAVGEFTMLRDREGLEVQVRQTPVKAANPVTDAYSGLTSCVSINTAMAARVGSHRIAFQPGKERGRLEFFVDGKPQQLTAAGLDLDGNHVSGFDAGGVTGLRVDYAHGPTLVVTPNHWSSHDVWYLNLNVSRTQADEGLMGTIPAGTWLPRLPTGVTVGPTPRSLHERYVTLYRTFANAWRVTDRTSLFVYAPGTSTATFTDEDWPAEKPPCKMKPQFETGTPVAAGMSVEKARQACRRVTLEDLNQDCVFDVATTGDESFAQGYLRAQELRLRGSAVRIASDKDWTRPGEVATFKATAWGLTRGRPVPKGRITFLVDGVAAGSVPLDRHGQARLGLSDLANGTHKVRAAYEPGKPSWLCRLLAWLTGLLVKIGLLRRAWTCASTSHQGSTSPALRHTVGAQQPKVAPKPTPAPSQPTHVHGGH